MSLTSYPGHTYCCCCDVVVVVVVVAASLTDPRTEIGSGFTREPKSVPGFTLDSDSWNRSQVEFKSDSGWAISEILNAYSRCRI